MCSVAIRGRGGAIFKLSVAQRWVATVALGHFAVDFTAMLPTMMYPFLASRMGLSLGLIGVASFVWATASSTCQPLFGYLGDRLGRRWLAAGTIAAMAVLVALIPNVQGFGQLVVLLAIAGIDVGAFHPQGGAIANEASLANKGTNVATFFLGGHLGFTVAPLVAGAVLASSGLEYMSFLVIPALLIALVLPFGLKGVEHVHQSSPVDSSDNVSALGLAIAAILVVALIRGWAYASLTVFIPLFVSPGNPDPTLFGSMLSIFLAFHAAGAFSGGVMADRFGVRLMVGVSSALIIPTIAGFALLQVGWSSYVLIAATGALIGAGFTPTVLLMQRLVPKRMGAGTGIVLGVSFGAGAIGNLITGFVGEMAGLSVAFLLLAVVQVLVLVALRWIPGRNTSGAYIG